MCAVELSLTSQYDNLTIVISDKLTNFVGCGGRYGVQGCGGRNRVQGCRGVEGGAG